MNTTSFMAYLKRCLIPTLKRGDIVMMDSLPVHKVAGVDHPMGSHQHDTLGGHNSPLRATDSPGLPMRAERQNLLTFRVV